MAADATPAALIEEARQIASGTLTVPSTAAFDMLAQLADALSDALARLAQAEREREEWCSKYSRELERNGEIYEQNEAEQDAQRDRLARLTDVAEAAKAYVQAEREWLRVGLGRHAAGVADDAANRLRVAVDDLAAGDVPSTVADLGAQLAQAEARENDERTERRLVIEELNRQAREREAERQRLWTRIRETEAREAAQAAALESCQAWMEHVLSILDGPFPDRIPATEERADGRAILKLAQAALAPDAGRASKPAPTDPIYVTTDRESFMWHVAMGQYAAGEEKTALCGLAAPGGRWDLSLQMVIVGWGKGGTGQSVCRACSSLLDLKRDDAALGLAAGEGGQTK